MKRILILVSQKRINAKLVAYLNLRLSNKAKVVRRTFEDVVIEVSKGDVGVWIGKEPIKNFDLVYFRKTGGKYIVLAEAMAICLEHLKIPYIDTTFGKIGPGSKLTSLARLAVNDLPIIPSYFCLADKISELSSKMVKKLGSVIVAKELRSQYSKGIFVLREKADFERLLRKGWAKKESQFLFQKFVELKSEYRLLVLGEKVVSVQKMTRDLSGFRAKIDYDLEEKYLNVNAIPISVRNTAVKAARVLDIQIAGIDVLLDQNNEWKLLEVNRGPAFTQDADISPEMKEVAKYLNRVLADK